MKSRFIIITVLSCVIYISLGVLAEDEIKRGTTYPFMAFIYYQDETILSLSGDRFLQGAVLVRSSFLISSSPESTISKDPLRKTLLARLGANFIDSKFTFNEDEDEQEQEVIEIIRPYEHDSTKWWITDICLLKTLQPFTSTYSVRLTQLSTKQEPADKVCHILIFKKISGKDYRLLTRLFVEVLPPSASNCGGKFVEKIMTCAADQPSNEDTQLADDYCHGNNGGPLICDDDVIALQTYINGDCKPPHLYQLLSPRKRFLDCGIGGKCDSKEQCQNVCSVIHKDSVPLMPNLTESASTEILTEPNSPEPTFVSTSAEPATQSETTKATLQTESEEAAMFTPLSPSSSSSVSSEPSTTEIVSSTDTTTSVTHTKSWPNEKEGRRKNDEETLVQPTNVEAQSRPVIEKHPKKKILRSGVNNNMIVFQSFVYSTFLLCICLS